MRSKIFVGLLAVGLSGCTVDPAPVWVRVSDVMAVGREGLSISQTTAGAIVTGGNLKFAGSTNFAEAFDPQTRSWKALPDVRGILTSCGETQRRDHQATVMPDGRILITGGGFRMSTKSSAGCACAYNETGCVDAFSQSFVVFDPDEQRTADCNNGASTSQESSCVPGNFGVWAEGWSRSFKMRKRHAMHTVTLLSTDRLDVQVLLLGGSGKTIEETLESIHYKNVPTESTKEPGSEVMCLGVEQWEGQAVEKVESASTDFVTGHTATPMKIDQGQVRSVLVFGGVVAGANVDDPTETGELIQDKHARILEVKFGGQKYDWLDAPANGPGPRVGHFAVRLDDHRILIAGGTSQNKEPLDDAWIFEHGMDGEAYHFRRIADMKHKHAFAAVAQSGDYVIVSGGYQALNVPSNSVEKFDAKSETWSDLPAMHEVRARHGLMRLPGIGAVFLATGGAMPKKEDTGATDSEDDERNRPWRVGELLYMNGPCGFSETRSNECSPGLICDIEEGRCVPLD